MSNTLFIGKVYYRFDELPSTNDWAAEFIANPPSTKTKPPEGTVVRADNQTAGRGQHGSAWESAGGKNLLLSVILYPTWLKVQNQFFLSMAVALALRDLVENNSPAAATKIKWPNDLYLGEKKTAGILIQNSISGAQIQHSIAGIGLNVNQSEFPESLPNATSMARFFGQTFNLDELAENLFECLERRYLQLKAGNCPAIKAEYEEHLWRRGQAAQFARSPGGETFEGIIHGVTHEGFLQIETKNGLEDFEVKSLKFLP